MGQDTRYMHDEYRQMLQNQEHQNTWQEQQNSIDRAWQEQQWQNQFDQETARQNEMFDKETARWYEQFDAQNAYNAPSAQVARLAAAGINPSVAALGGNTGNSGAVLSQGSPSSPSPPGLQGKSVSPAVPPHFSSVNNAAQMFSSIAQLNDSLAQMAKSGSDISVEQRKIKPVIENTIADTQNKQSMAALNDVIKEIKTNFGSDEAAANIVKLLSEASAADAAGKRDDASAKYNEAMAELTKQEKWQKNEQFPQIMTNLKQYGATLKAQETAGYASAEASRASAMASVSEANYKDVLADTAKKLQSGQVDAQILANGCQALTFAHQKMDNDLFFKSFGYQLDKIMWESKTAGYISTEQLQKAQLAIKENDWYTVNQVLGHIEKVSPTFVVPFNVPLKK